MEEYYLSTEFLIIMFVISLILIGLGILISLITNTIRRKDCEVKTKAFVYDINRRVGMSNTRFNAINSDNFLVCKYKDKDGNDITAGYQYKHRPLNVKIGRDITIWYDQDNSEHFVPKFTPLASKVFIICGIILPIVCLIPKYGDKVIEFIKKVIG